MKPPQSYSARIYLSAPNSSLFKGGVFNKSYQGSLAISGSGQDSRKGVITRVRSRTSIAGRDQFRLQSFLRCRLTVSSFTKKRQTIEAHGNVILEMDLKTGTIRFGLAQNREWSADASQNQMRDRSYCGQHFKVH